jgi:hypothetical protein
LIFQLASKTAARDQASAALLRRGEGTTMLFS